MSYRPCRNVDGHQRPPASSDRPARNAAIRMSSREHCHHM